MQTLFYNGEILTMCTPRPAGAVLIEGGRILAVGEVRALCGMAGRGVEVVDLGGCAMIPGLVDCGGDFWSAVCREMASAGGRGGRCLRAAALRVARRYLERGITVLHARGLDAAAARALAHCDLPLPLYLDIDIADYEGVKRVAALSRGRLHISGLSLDLDVRDDGGIAVGEAAYCDRAVAFALRMAAAEGVAPVIRAESEAAVRQFLRVARAMARVCPALPALRPVLLDARFLPPTEMDAVRALGAVPCFAADILPRMGDELLFAWGLTRVARMVPYAAARAAGVPYTLCHVGGAGEVPDVWGLVCAAVSRRTARGSILGAAERASVSDALCAVTRHGAWRYHAEGTFGSIRAGMSANFAVLSGGILSVPTDELAGVAVAEVWYGGERVTRRAVPAEGALAEKGEVRSRTMV